MPNACGALSNASPRVRGVGLHVIVEEPATSPQLRRCALASQGVAPHPASHQRDCTGRGIRRPLRRSSQSFRALPRSDDGSRCQYRPDRCLLARLAQRHQCRGHARKLRCACRIPRLREQDIRVHRIGQAARHRRCFTFGREEPIPSMFRKLVGSLAQRQTAVLQPLVLYLDRHIELDENHHGPMALEMLAELCGEEVQLWDQASDAAVSALSARLTLWNTVMSEIRVARMRVPAGYAPDRRCNSIPQGRGEITSAA
jgi:hypothetical protein